MLFGSVSEALLMQFFLDALPFLTISFESYKEKVNERLRCESIFDRPYHRRRGGSLRCST